MGIGWVVFGVIALTQRRRIADQAYDQQAWIRHLLRADPPPNEWFTFQLVMGIVGGVIGLVGGGFMIVLALR